MGEFISFLILDADGNISTNTPTWATSLNAQTGSAVTPPTLVSLGNGQWKFASPSSYHCGNIHLGVGASPEYCHVPTSAACPIDTICVYDTAGAPVAGHTPVFEYLKNKDTGVAITPPVIAELSGGVYKFLKPINATGVLNFGAGASPLRGSYDSADVGIGLMSIAVAATTLTLTFNVDVFLSGASAVATNWGVTSAGTGVLPVVTGVSVVGNQIVLTTTEGTGGLSAVLHIPDGITDGFGNPFLGPFAEAFTTQEIVLVIALSGSVDGLHVKIVFSKTVVRAEALTATNYSIPGLVVYSVAYETETSYILRTSPQNPGTVYTVTASNIHDLFGNEI